MTGSDDEEDKMRHSGRPGSRNGSQRDALGADHTDESWAAGVRKGIKRQANRNDRHETRTALRTGREV